LGSFHKFSFLNDTLFGSYLVFDIVHNFLRRFIVIIQQVVSIKPALNYALVGYRFLVEVKVRWLRFDEYLVIIIVVVVILILVVVVVVVI